jgi:hypothetical protein
MTIKPSPAFLHTVVAYCAAVELVPPNSSWRVMLLWLSGKAAGGHGKAWVTQIYSLRHRLSRQLEVQEPEQPRP